MARKQRQTSRRTRQARDAATDGDPFVHRGIILRADGPGRKYTQHEFIAASPGILFSVQGATTPFAVLGAQYVSFNQIGNYTQYSQLYDQYRIDSVEVTVAMRQTSANPTHLPRLCYYPDFDDAQTPPSEAAVFMHPRVRIHQFSAMNPIVKFSFVPKVAMSVFQGAFSGYGMPVGKIFLDSNSPAAQHYGYKYSIENNLDPNVYLDWYVKVWITMRNPL